MTEKINSTYQIPESFFQVIKPYVIGEKPGVYTQSNDLIAMWKQALSAHNTAPEYSGHIAEWAMSAGASSPLLSDERFEEIHFLFGMAEVEEEETWQQIEALVLELANQEDHEPK